MNLTTMPPAVVAPHEGDESTRIIATDCTRRSKLGERCYKAHPADMARWCEGCRDGQDPDGPLPEWMGGTIVQDGPRPAVEDHYEPSRVAEAEWSGFQLGCNGFAVVGPAHYSADELAAFTRGHAAGFAAFEAECWEDYARHHEQEDAAFDGMNDRVDG